MADQLQSKRIEVRDLYKEFDDKVVLQHISTDFMPGQVNLIIGRSGAGKTVLLKSLIGLITPTSGQILFDGQDLLSMSKHELKSLRQRMGVLFQGSALFDSMTVMENVLFPLQIFSKMTRSERLHHASKLLERVGLEHAGRKYPSEISGGMMKRVAIARAVVLNPLYLFCDEPNSGLDPTTSASIDSLLKSVTEEYHITTVINTHDMNTVRTIGDHIIYLSDGQVAWQGSSVDMQTDAPQSLKLFMMS